MSDKIKIAVTVPNKLKNELRESVIKNGYGLRGKSIWISEAIESLLEIENYPELVEYNDEMGALGHIETLTIDYRLKLKLEDAILKIRLKFPMLEGVKSRLIRTAILQRLLRDKNFSH